LSEGRGALCLGCFLDGRELVEFVRRNYPDGPPRVRAELREGTPLRMAAG
jgi:hypothetical protein